MTRGNVSQTEQKATTIMKEGYTSQKGTESPSSVQKTLIFWPKARTERLHWGKKFHLVCSEIKKQNQGLVEGIHAWHLGDK